ncbi:hypothetical protein V6N12_001467 [Hibiscus sabdariffa]|uniref:PGG domain-containing protein n=1 Tax=Hibiscus sabdariffa TaxID=183260 RepID=A0ABR2BQP7_9ROSI
MIRLLLNSSVEKNLTNMDNSTPLDILPKANNEEARNILESAGGLRADDLPNFPTLPAFLQTNITPFESMHKAADRQRKNLPSNTRSALLVVAGLTLTATYNASLNPPGGISPGPRNSCTGGFLSSSSNNSTADYLLKSFTVEDHPLGKSVMTPGIFLVFYTLNTLCFFLTNLVTFQFLLSDAPAFTRRLLVGSLTFLFLCYLYAFTIITPTTVFLFVFAVVLLLIASTQRWLRRRSRYATYLRKKYKYKHNPDGGFWSLY